MSLKLAALELKVNSIRNLNDAQSLNIDQSLVSFNNPFNETQPNENTINSNDNKLDPLVQTFTIDTNTFDIKTEAFDESETFPPKKPVNKRKIIEDDQLDTLDQLNSLDSLDPIDPLLSFDSLDPLDPLDPPDDFGDPEILPNSLSLQYFANTYIDESETPGSPVKEIIENSTEKPEVTQTALKIELSEDKDHTTTNRPRTRHNPRDRKRSKLDYAQLTDLANNIEKKSSFDKDKNRLHDMYFCSIQDCNYTSNRKADVKRHLLTHCTHKAYGCDLCTCRYIDPHYLKRHYRKTHQKTFGREEKMAIKYFKPMEDNSFMYIDNETCYIDPKKLYNEDLVN